MDEEDESAEARSRQNVTLEPRRDQNPPSTYQDRRVVPRESGLPNPGGGGGNISTKSSQQSLVHNKLSEAFNLQSSPVTEPSSENKQNDIEDV